MACASGMLTLALVITHVPLLCVAIVLFEALRQTGFGGDLKAGRRLA